MKQFNRITVAGEEKTVSSAPGAPHGSRTCMNQKRRSFVKWAVVMLCVIQVFLLIGCNGKKGDTGGSTAPAESTGAPTSGGVDENGYQLDGVGTQDFGNEVIDILYWSDRSCQEFESSGKDSDMVNNALYDRNRKVESRLNVNFNFVGKAGNFEHKTEFTSTVSNDALNDREYDMYACYGPLASTFALSGYSADLSSLNYLDFDQPWWPENVVSNLSLGDKLYFATGDVSSNLLWMMQVCLFNLNLKSTKGLTQDFYSMVENGEWTVANFMEICTDIYTGTAGEQSLQDTYGLVTHANVFDAWVIGAGICAIEKDDYDMPMISSSYGSERMANLVEDLSDWFLNSDDVFISKAGGGKNAFTDARQLFEEGKSLFIVDKLYIVQSGSLKDMTDKYGLLPMPMYGEEQTEYYTDIGQTHTQYCIANKEKSNADITAAVLECMASESYRQVIPVLYFKVMKLRYAKDEQSSQIFDLLRERITFDFGKIFQFKFADETGGNSLTRELYINAINKGYDWKIQYDANKGAITEKILELTVQLG